MTAFSSLRLSRQTVATCLLAAASFAHGADLSAVRKLDYSGDQSAVAAIDQQIVTAGRDTAKLRAVAAQVGSELRQTSLTFAARQVLAQRLGNILALNPTELPDEATLAALRRMLVSERDVDLGRLALEQVPGPAVDRLFIDALKKSEGRVRVALLQALGARRSPVAIGEIKPLLADNDPAVAAAAAYALGHIGTSDGATALRNAPNPASPTVVSALLTLAPRLAPSEAAALTDALAKDNRVPASLRGAALRINLDADVAHATARTLDALTNAEWPVKEAVIESIYASQAPMLVQDLSAKLATWDAPTQTAVIAALGRRGDAVATNSIVAALKHSAPEVRAAAITALGTLPGTPETVKAVGVIAGAESDEAKLAKQSLARMNGPGVDAAILEGAKSATGTMRIALLEQIALRNMTQSLPVLREARRADDPLVRAAAVGALGEVAPVSEQPLLIEWSLQAADANEQSRALRALVALTQRMPNAATRAQPIVAALEKADPASAAKAVPVLARLGDRASADAAARLALSSDASLASAAVATLTRWPDHSALPALGTVVEKSSNPANRKTAQQAALRLLERNRDPWTEEFSVVVGQLVGATEDAKAREQLVRLLARAADERAAKVAESLSQDSTVGATAKNVAEAIKVNRQGAPRLSSSNGSANVKNLIDGKTSTRWSVPALADEWLEIDFGATRPVFRLSMDQSGRPADYPEKFDVYVTEDRKQPGKAVVSGAGRTGQTVIDLPAGTRGRYVIIKNTADRAEGNWSIAELLIE